MIQVRDICKSEYGKPVLVNVSFDAEAERITALMGESRSGRSALFKIILGIERPDSGTVTIMGKDVHRISEMEMNRLWKMRGIVYEQTALWSDLTAAGNVARPIEEHRLGMPRSEILRVVDEKLDLVHMVPHKDKKPWQLSGGEKRRVAIARGIALDPQLLFCDEPTAGLDPPLLREVCAILRNLNKALKVTCLVATHDPDTAFAIADKLVILKPVNVEKEDASEGFTVGAQGPPREVEQLSDPYIRRFLSRRANPPSR